MKGSEEWVIAKGPCSAALNLITLQCSNKWNALQESWGHWEVSDWHIGWHRSNVPIPRRITGFNCPQSTVMNEFSTLDGEILFLHTFTSLALHENLMKLLLMLTGCLDQSVNLFAAWPPGPLVRPRQWPKRPYGQWGPIHGLPVVFVEAVSGFIVRGLLLFRCIRLQWLPDDTYSEHHLDWYHFICGWINL